MQWFSALLVGALTIAVIAAAPPGVHAAGPPGADACTGPPTPLVLPADGMGSTAAATDTVSLVADGCLQVPTGMLNQTPGRDHIYSFTLAAPGTVQVDATTSDLDFDLQIYLLSTCGDGSSCIAGSDIGCSINDGVIPIFCNGSPAESITASLDAGTYYLYVDSFDTNAGGNYTLSVPEPGSSAAALAALAGLAGCALWARKRHADLEAPGTRRAA